MVTIRSDGFFFRENRGGAALSMADGGERRRSSPEARRSDGIRSVLGQTGRGLHGESTGPVGLVGESSEKGSATRNRGGVFAGAREEGGSRGYLRRGSSLGASTSYGEYFAQINSAGAALQRRLHGGPSVGGYGDCGWAYLWPNHPIERSCEHQWRVAKLTGLRVIDEDARK